MTDLAIKADIDNTPLGSADLLLVQRQGDQEVSRAPANSLPIPAATAQALSNLQTAAANDASSKANAAQTAAVGAAANDATTKADAARTAAINAAAMDATNKADAARTAAIDAIPTSTDELDEGASSSRRYFSEQRVLDTSLNGLVAGPASPIAANDKIIEAFAKLQAQQSATANVAANALPANQRGAINGVAELVNGLVPSNRLPSFVDDVLEFPTLANFPATGETGKIYIAINGANIESPSRQYRWSGTAYSEITRR